jgi:hypothetical protein
MNKLRLLGIAASSTAIFVTNQAEARIGETKKEVAERYGEPIFSHVSKSGFYARYKFKDKVIEAAFVDDEVKFEALHFNRERVYSEERGKQLGKETGEFVVSLLTNAYDFTKEKAAEVVLKQGTLISYGREAAKFSYDMNSLAQEIFGASLTVQQSEMDDNLKAKVDGVLSEGFKALKAKELNKQSDGF